MNDKYVNFTEPNITAVIEKDPWAETDDSEEVLVIRADDVVTHVFSVDHPVAVCYLQQLEENKRLLEENKQLRIEAFGYN